MTKEKRQNEYEQKVNDLLIKRSLFNLFLLKILFIVTVFFSMYLLFNALF